MLTCYIFALNFQENSGSYKVYHETIKGNSKAFHSNDADFSKILDEPKTACVWPHGVALNNHDDFIVYYLEDAIKDRWTFALQKESEFTGNHFI